VGVQSHLWVLLAALIVGSAVAIYYYLRVIFAMSKPCKVKGKASTGFDRTLAIILMACVLLLGSWPQPFIAFTGTL
jgi:NADH-quinone oxidoreductase subunit N